MSMVATVSTICARRSGATRSNARHSSQQRKGDGLGVAPSRREGSGRRARARDGRRREKGGLRRRMVTAVGARAMGERKNWGKRNTGGEGNFVEKMTLGEDKVWWDPSLSTARAWADTRHAYEAEEANALSPGWSRAFSFKNTFILTTLSYYRAFVGS
jgi:hypothetical protein